MRTLFLTLVTCLFVLPAHAKYSGGRGEPNDPYQLATAEDLMLLGDSPDDYDKHFILTADIDLDPNLPGRKVFDKAVIAPGAKNANWEFDGTPFTGVFNGNSHTISHLIVTGGNHLGLFGRLGSRAEVERLGVVDVNVAGSGYYVGGLVGENYDGTVTQCYSSGAVSGDRGVGGLAGSNGRTVTQCNSASTVSGNEDVGELVGSNRGDVTQCCSTGTVAGSAFVGGLIGKNRGAASECYSSGTVTGDEDVGGLVGYNQSKGYVTCCYSTCTVTGDEDVGGLVGENYEGVVTDCYSTATVSGTYSVGGLVGYNDYGNVTQCCSTGTVKGDEGVAGLVGSNSGDVSRCYSTGRVRGDQDVGGLVGWNYRGSVTECYNAGAVSGNWFVGGLVGSNASCYSQGGIVTQCYSTGQVSGGYSVGGLVGKNGYILGSYKSEGTVSRCYSAGRVSGNASAGGLIGLNEYGSVIFSFWDVRASRQGTSAGGTGKTTGEMKMGATFLKAGWDFVDETTNGTEDIWRILEGEDYPRLGWEVPRGKYSGGNGEPNDPYQIATAGDLIALGETPEDYDKHFILTADIDLDPNLPAGKVFDEAVIAPDTNPNDTVSDFQDTPFTGVFDGNGFMILHPVIRGKDFVGLFGYLAPKSKTWA